MIDRSDPTLGDLHALVDEYRATCLWFLRRDYYPTTRDQQLRVLNYVQRYGDREGFVRAAALRQWHLRGHLP